MANPYLPGWEYIPDGEPRVFGDRVYIYGSHDGAGSDKFCDYKLKVWSASIYDLNNWVCHGDIFHTRDDRDHKSDTPWTQNDLYAPDVVYKGGKYYLYAYIYGATGCVAVSDRPEGPFTLISQYKYPQAGGEGKVYGDGWFVDPGVLVDDDGKVYIYCGFEHSFAAQVNPDNMYEIIPGSCIDNIIPALPKDDPEKFFEAASVRKVKDTYYLVYSPRKGSRLAYATASSPIGPFTYRGVIIDNEKEYPGGNNHGSICCINGQWYIFYHRMTNGTIMSRRDCVERIRIMDNGTIPQVEMTSLGFEASLNPYRETQADIACVLKGGCFITERSVFERPVTAITDGCVIGYRYFDFGEDYSSRTMEFCMKVRGTGCRAAVHLMIDSDVNGKEIGICAIEEHDGICRAVVENVTGRHALYFIIQSTAGGWFKEMFNGRHLFELDEFVFTK
jgi:arabinoxylan arabinofuranohydrolase